MRYRRNQIFLGFPWINLSDSDANGTHGISCSLFCRSTILHTVAWNCDNSLCLKMNPRGRKKRLWAFRKISKLHELESNPPYIPSKYTLCTLKDGFSVSVSLRTIYKLHTVEYFSWTYCRVCQEPVKHFFLKGNPFRCETLIPRKIRANPSWLSTESFSGC